MKNKWNLFWEDYVDLWHSSCHFCRKHWLGMIIYFAVCVVMFVLSLTDVIDRICDWFDGLIEKAKSKFRKTK